MMPDAFDIIDISQPISARTACFPGDTPFSRQVTVSYAQSQVINLCAFTMSPHVGTHADAPVHIHGDLESCTPGQSAGELPLEAFIGPVVMIDIAPCTGPIAWELVAPQIEQFENMQHGGLPPRVLFRTRPQLRFDLFENDYAWFSVELVRQLAQRGIRLMGLDTPSVDHTESKNLETHHAMLESGMSWLENLDLSSPKIAPLQPYLLLAAPLKFMELEASPVRAVLLKALN